MPGLKETDFDSMANAVRYLENAELWIYSAAKTLETTGTYTFRDHPRKQEILSLAKSISRLDKKLLKLREELKGDLGPKL